MKTKTKTAIFLYNANLYQQAINKILEIPEVDRIDDDLAVFIISEIMINKPDDYISLVINLSSVSYIKDLELFKKYLIKLAKTRTLIDDIPTTITYDDTLDLSKDYDFFPKYADTNLTLSTELPINKAESVTDPSDVIYNAFINELKLKVNTKEDITSFISTFDQSSLSEIKKLRILGFELKYNILTKNYDGSKDVITSILSITNSLETIEIDMHSIIAEFIYEFLDQHDIVSIMDSTNSIIENTPSEMNIVYDKYSMKNGLTDKVTLENYITKFRTAGYDVSNSEHFNVLLDIQKGL